MRHKFDTVYDILDELRERPAMFLGNLYVRNPLATLRAFIHGLQFSEIDGGEPSFWEFNRWVIGYVDEMSNNLPWDWLEDQRGGEQGFQDFFTYLDEYRKCRIVQVASPIIHEFIPRFRRLDSNLDEMAPPIPDSIHIGQFAPSEVFFLAEMYGDKMEMEFPYPNTIDGAIAEARSRWSVPETPWNSV